MRIEYHKGKYIANAKTGKEVKKSKKENGV